VEVLGKNSEGLRVPEEREPRDVWLTISWKQLWSCNTQADGVLSPTSPTGLADNTCLAWRRHTSEKLYRASLTH
jgi:hypothetical protein